MPVVTFPGLAPAVPEVVLVCAAMALLIIGALRGEGSSRLVSWLSVAVLVATLVIAGLLGGERQVGFYGMFVSDAFAVFMKALVLLASLLGAGARPWAGLVIGVVFVAVGFAFKCSAVRFHMWPPDVYEGAPPPVTAFFSVAPKIAAVALFVRFLIEPLGGLLAEWRQIIVFLSVASMILGAVAAIAQQNTKRLIAYSSIGHVGVALIGLP